MLGNFIKLSSLEEAEERLDAVPPELPSGEGGLRLPSSLHFIWVGGRAPVSVETRIRTWAQLNPACVVVLWDERAIAGLAEAEESAELAELLAVVPNPAALSDVGRFAILNRFGGIYLDSDMEACRPIASLLSYSSGFVVRESKWLLTASAVGLPRRSLFGQAALRSMSEVLRKREAIDNFATGPPLITELSRGARSLGMDGPAVLPEWTFFPDNPFRFPRESRSPFPPYAIHLFDHSWAEGGELRVRRRLARGVLQLLLPRDTAVGQRRPVQLELRRITTVELASAVSAGA